MCDPEKGELFKDYEKKDADDVLNLYKEKLKG
jgi:hypothetical protein